MATIMDQESRVNFMSRKSQAFSSGQPAFSWKVSKEDDGHGGERYRVVCRNHPTVQAVDASEQVAILKARHAMETAVDRVDNKMIGPGDNL